MNISIIKKDALPCHPVCEELTLMLDSVEGVKQTFALTGGFCCLHEGQKVLLYDNRASEFCFFCDEQINSAFNLFVKQFLNKTAVDIDLAYRLLAVAGKLDFGEKDFFALFPLLGWPSSKKGLEYRAVLDNCSMVLRRKVLDKKLALNEAVLFHNTFKEGYDDFLQLLPEKLTFSELTKSIRNIAEVERKYEIGIDKITNFFTGCDRNDFVEAARTLRYPLYRDCKEKFEAFTGGLPLVKGTRLVYDPLFEKEQYTLEIGFSSLKKLQERLKVLDTNFSALNPDQLSDYFDQSVLFDQLKSGPEALKKLLESKQDAPNTDGSGTRENR